jgi:hypothetical protein
MLEGLLLHKEAAKQKLVRLKIGRKSLSREPCIFGVGFDV